MSRAALILLLGMGAEALWPVAAGAADANPHLDPSVVPGGCTVCHEGHGASRSPMLPGPQVKVCLSCHGSRAGLDQQVRKGSLAAASRPQRLSALLAKPFVHALSKTAFSEDEPGAVTCTSCHSPHRGMRGSRSGADPPGRPRLSPKDPARFEYELCESCHGSAGVATQSLVDISRLLNPTNLSYHPVEAPSFESSPSVIPSLTGRQINCTDCHGNSDAAGVRGPHGSDVPFILRANYLTLDGNAESPSAYALCYTCHRREAVLNSSAFPEHGAHIIPLRASCATCHNAHGSVTNRALVRFGEETVLAGVAPSARTGRLAFVSDGPGTGACYLTCHGYDHAPEAYGGLELFTETASDPVQLGPVWIRDGLGGTLGGRPVKDRPSRLRPPKRRPKH